jgi:nucleobase:cation symporter-1, NCS1 family
MPHRSSASAARSHRPEARATLAGVTRRATSWGIDPVPERLRVLGTFDLGLLWGNLGVSLLVVVAGAILVPALSLPAALVAIVVGCVVGNLMLAIAGGIGAQVRVPAMVLMRAPLGERGSYLPTAINVVQCLGWTVFELLVIATAAAALSEEVFGFEARWAWTLVFGAAALALGLLGPIGVVRSVLRRFAVWIVPFAVAYLCWWALSSGGVDAAWNRPGEGGLSTWQGIDIVVGVTVSWIPLAADYTRFARSPGAAFWGTGVGYFVPDALLLALGAVVLLTRDVADPAALPAAVAAGGIVALFALVALTVAETDEAFANAYSGAVSLQNLVPWMPQKLLVVATTTLGIAGALVLELTSFQSFLFLLGSFFVPLFAVLLAAWLASSCRFEQTDVFAAPPLRLGMLGAWLAGFASYQWLSPTGPSWWVEQVQRLDPPSWAVGATLPSFAVSFVLATLVAAVDRMRDDTLVQRA